MPEIEDSRMRLMSVIAVCTTIIGVGVAVGRIAWRTANNITAGLTDLANHMQTQERALEELKSHTYTLEKASEQALRMAIANPGTRVPDPRDPTRIIEVERPH